MRFFGLVGAFIGGVIQPFGMHWFFGGFLGFVVAGMGAGYLSESRIGRKVLGVAALGVVAFFGLAIMMG